MAKITIDLGDDMVREVDRIVRDGWYRSSEEVVTEAIRQYVGAKTYLGDSPRMLQRFAADALNESKPETALKFADRSLSLLTCHKLADLTLYQQIVELRVQILLVLDRYEEARSTLEEAREKLPNSPSILRWLERVTRRATTVETETKEASG